MFHKNAPPVAEDGEAVKLLSVCFAELEYFFGGILFEVIELRGELGFFAHSIMCIGTTSITITTY